MKNLKYILVIGLVGFAAACGNKDTNNNNNNGCPANYTFVPNGTATNYNNPYGNNPYGGYNSGYGQYPGYGQQTMVPSSNGTGQCIANTTGVNGQVCTAGQVQTAMGCLATCTNGYSAQAVLLNNQCVDINQVAATPNGQYPVYPGQYPGQFPGQYPGYGQYPGMNFGVGYAPGYNFRSYNYGPLNVQVGYPRLW